VHRYVKGARSERELINFFYKLNYSVIRSAGSGVNSLSPDIIVIKNKQGFAFECKAWDRTSLSIDKDRYQSLVDWETNTGMSTFLAWRMNIKGWYFIKLDEMNETNKHYTVTMTKALTIGRNLDKLII
jgi:Holliday junction resolvase